MKRKIKIIGKIFFTLLSIISSIASIIGLAYTFFSGVGQGYWLFGTGLFIGLIAVISMVGFHFNNDSAQFEQSAIYAKGFHELLHDIRNILEEDDLIHSEKPYNNTHEYRKKITENSIKLMNHIVKLLGEATGFEVRACVKLFNFLKTDGSKQNNVITFARNGHTVNEMFIEQNVLIDIFKNTDFEYIYNSKHDDSVTSHSFFFQEDLEKYARGLKRRKQRYCNTNHYWKKEYKTAIVMPIRFLKISPESDSAYYDLIGYLCVDAKETKAFQGNYQPFIIELLKGISDILYHYYNGCTVYYKELSNVLKGVSTSNVSAIN